MTVGEIGLLITIIVEFVIIFLFNVFYLEHFFMKRFEATFEEKIALLKEKSQSEDCESAKSDYSINEE